MWFFYPLLKLEKLWFLEKNLKLVFGPVWNLQINVKIVTVKTFNHDQRFNLKSPMTGEYEKDQCDMTDESFWIMGSVKIEKIKQHCRTVKATKFKDKA